MRDIIIHKLPSGKRLIFAKKNPDGFNFKLTESNYKHHHYGLRYDLPVPENCGYTSHQSYCFLVKDFGSRKNYPKPGSLELLGDPFKLTEEKWNKIVESSEYYDPHAQPYPIPSYKGYGDNVWKWSALESGQSLLSSLGIYNKNPFGADRCQHNRQCYDSCQGSCWKDISYDEWEEAENNLNSWVLILES